MSNEIEKHAEIRVFTDPYAAAVWLLAIFRICCVGGDDYSNDAQDEQAARSLERLLRIARNDPDAAERMRAHRFSEIARRKDRLAGSVLDLGLFWFFEIDQGFPRGPFPDLESGGRPAAASGADFIYMALRSIGLVFNDAAFQEHFHGMQRHLAEIFGMEEEDEQ